MLVPKEALPKAKAAALKALELDSTLGEAHNSLAFLLDGFDWDLDSGGREFRRAIEENPRLPGAHYLLAAVLLATGNDASPLDAAEAELKKELVISPGDSMTYAALGKIAVTRNNYPEAETYLKKAIIPRSPRNG